MIKNEKFAIVGGTLIDGTGKQAQEDAGVIVEGARIVAVGKSESLPLSDCDRRVDASGLTIMPGLIDCHVQFSGCRGEDYVYWMGLVESKLLRAMRATADARKVLDAGFTTVGDMGTVNAIYLKRGIEEGTLAGPRIIPCGRALCRTGGHGDMRRDLYDLPDDFVRESLAFCEICDGIDGVRKAVRKMQGMGAEVIKFFASGGGIWENDRPEHQHYTLEEMKAIVDEAHMLGMKVNAHAEGLSGTRAAIEAGVDVIHHGDVLDKSICKDMINNDIILVPTISIYYVGPWAAWEVQQKSFKIAHGAGVKIALGSDVYLEPTTPYGAFNAGELRRLVEWGMTPMEAIVSATKTGSQALGIDDRVGTLERGKLADILLVDGNPLEDITFLLDKKRIPKVFKEGRDVERL